MSKRRKIAAKGRGTGKQPFVMLSHWAFDCPAYRSLKPGPRALLWEMIRKFNGGNNGRIGFSQRAMSAAINVADRETVAGYVRELEARGFILAHRRGGFCVKVADRRATEWVLTMFPHGDQLATKDFMRWRPDKISGAEKPAAKVGKAVRDGSNDVHPRSNVRESPSLGSPKLADPRTENPSTYTFVAIAGAKHRTETAR